MSLALQRAAAGYTTMLGLSLVVADAQKVPLVSFFPRGVLSASRDLELIGRALRSCSGATLAARVGDHVVLDVDVRHGGPEQLERLEQGFGALPRTWRAETPSGGLHVWFRGVDTPLRGRIARGIEVLRANRLVTVSPSQRADGRYRWTHNPLTTPEAEAPRWLLDLARLPEMPPPVQRSSTDDQAARIERARAYLQKVPPALSGSGGHVATFRAAQILVRGFDLDPDAALPLLTEWNRSCCPPWSPRELRRKIVDAMRNGRMPIGVLAERERAA